MDSNAPHESCILHSGHTYNGASHTEGVGFMLYRQAEKSLISWQPVSSRLIATTFKTKQKRILVRLIMCYAPSNEACDEVKDQFNGRLKRVLGNNGPQRELTILMDDMNDITNRRSSAWILSARRNFIPVTRWQTPTY